MECISLPNDTAIGAQQLKGIMWGCYGFIAQDEKVNYCKRLRQMLTKLFGMTKITPEFCYYFQLELLSVEAEAGENSQVIAY